MFNPKHLRNRRRNNRHLAHFHLYFRLSKGSSDGGSGGDERQYGTRNRSACHQTFIGLRGVTQLLESDGDMGNRFRLSDVLSRRMLNNTRRPQVARDDG